VTDLGMVGALHSVPGMDTERVIERFLTQLPNRFDPAEKGPAVQLRAHHHRRGNYRALSIERVDREVA
jgi:calcineurin-like phosphoesterase